MRCAGNKGVSKSAAPSSRITEISNEHARRIECERECAPPHTLACTSTRKSFERAIHWGYRNARDNEAGERRELQKKRGEHSQRQCEKLTMGWYRHEEELSPSWCQHRNVKRGKSRGMRPNRHKERHRLWLLWLGASRRLHRDHCRCQRNVPPSKKQRFSGTRRRI